MRSEKLIIGETFPDYELPDQTGRRWKLSELQGNDPMIVVLSRGSICPKERQQHRKLVEFYPELKVDYARIVTISTDDLLATDEFRDGLGAQWPFLSDPGHIEQRDLDIKEYTDPEHDPMIPHTIVLEPGLRIYKVYNGYGYWGRPSLEELRFELREITRKIRPDWHITDPQLRSAWESGNRQVFFPYEKSLGGVFASERTGSP